MPNKGPSINLSWKELACKDGTLYPEKFIKDGRVFRLAELFEDIRALFNNKPLVILSAYRTEAHNKSIGGALNSQHVLGRALDIRPPEGISVNEFYNKIYDNRTQLGLGGIGKYKTFVHVDIRPGNHLAVWSGSGPKDSLT